MWKWIGKISALSASAVVWDDRLDNPEAEIFVVTVDGTDFRIWEPKHPAFPMDKSYCSHKYKHAALRYEIAISIHTGKVVWINGPHRGGKSDLTIYREALQKRIRSGKLVVADRGYRDENAPEISVPNRCDAKNVNKFKSRARCRHETFNGRLKNFSVLNETFRHGQLKHKLAFEAVVVLVQKQMDEGNNIYDTV